MSELQPATIDGITINREDAIAMRNQVIKWRDASYSQWPEAIPFTVDATAIIALLAWVVDIYPTTTTTPPNREV